MAVEKHEHAVEDESFEKNLERLEAIVRTLEQGEVPLEESLALFEEGVRLARLCSKRLDDVEGKIEVLLRMEDDNPVTAPFAETGADTETEGQHE